MATGLTQLAGNLKSRYAGQHDIEDDHVERIRSAQFKSFNTIMRQHDDMVLLLQTFLQESGHLLFVLYDQDSHPRC